MKTKLTIIFFIFIVSLFSLPAQPTNYTYNYDFWMEDVASPDAYRVSAYILGYNLGIGNFHNPQGLFIRDNRIYICDSGNNRIVLLEAKENGEYELAEVVSSTVIDGVESPFAYPMDIFECRDGFLYIADTNNRRVLKLDRNWNYIASIHKPDDESIEAHSEFIPQKLVVDFANRLFVQAQNINRGLMEFDSRGEFSGYMGANKVQVNPIDYIWKMLSTRAQRKRMSLFVPTEYNNVSLDHEGFIYTTNAVLVTNSVKVNKETDPVRRLNAMGQDILVRNGLEDPIGDLYHGSAGGIIGESRFIDVTAFDNDSYACFDRTRGRIFIYDFQGNLLYAFGGVGNREGYFQQPVALASMGYSLFALDSRSSALTRFDLTAYGALINRAMSEYRAGRYESSSAAWEEILKVNGNYDLAYINIAHAALRQGDYKKAMDFYKLKHYPKGYGKAFQLYRKEWMERNLWKIFLGLAILAIGPPLIRAVVRIIREIKQA
jgi:tetratricopeptide (TPR) repeat protein